MNDDRQDLIAGLVLYALGLALAILIIALVLVVKCEHLRTDPRGATRAPAYPGDSYRDYAR